MNAPVFLTTSAKEAPIPQNRHRLNAAFAPFLIAALFFAVNLFYLGSYGESTDELANGIRASFAERCFRSFFVPKHQGEVLKKPAERFYYHPVLYAFAEERTAAFLQRRFGASGLTARHAVNLAVASFGVLAVYFLARRLFNGTVALYAQLFLVLYPHFIGHAHYNLKDVPVMVFSIPAILFGYLAIKEGGTRRWFWAGIWWGIAVSTKLDGLFTGAVVLAGGLFRVFRKNGGPSVRRLAGGLCVFALTGGAVIYLSWPVLWFYPSFFWDCVKHFAGPFQVINVFYFGKWGPASHVPWHYSVVHLFMATPTLTFVCFLAGAAALWKTRGSLESFLLFFWFAFPLIMHSLPHVMRYDGMRHLFLILPAMTITAAAGLEKLLSPVRNVRLKVFIPVLLASMVLLEVKEIHPYEGSYFNEITRLLIPRRIGKLFAMDYWFQAYREGSKWVSLHAENGAAIKIQRPWLCTDYFLRRKDLVLLPEDSKVMPDYVMDTTSQPSQIPPGSAYRGVYALRLEGSEFMVDHVMDTTSLPFQIPPGSDYREVYAVSRYHEDLLRVYKRVPEPAGRSENG